MQNPLVDAVNFLFQPAWTTVVFWTSLIASIAIAVAIWRRQPDQRSSIRVWDWFLRVLIGAMWWKQSLWKLPPHYTDQPDKPFGETGLAYWMIQMTDNAAFSLHAEFVKQIILPYFSFFAPIVYFIEVGIGVSLILGLFTRLGGALGALMALNLWLGLYRSPSEWAWNYVFLLALHGMFALHGVGRSLGLDALVVAWEDRTAHTSSWRSRVLKFVS